MPKGLSQFEYRIYLLERAGIISYYKLLIMLLIIQIDIYNKFCLYIYLKIYEVNRLGCFPYMLIFRFHFDHIDKQIL